MSSTNLDLLDQFEVGRTFFELIEFSLERKLSDGRVIKGIYGVNVAKVREVVHMPKINPLASRIPGVAGIFELRGVPIPAINLCQILGDFGAQTSTEQQIIVTEFSAKRAGFIVSTTHRIRRVAWDKVMPPSSDGGSCMSGMILIEDNNFLFILDLEKILGDIEAKYGEVESHSPYAPPMGGGLHQSFQAHAPAALAHAPAAAPSGGPSLGGILFVDDSKLILNNVSRVLEEKGYKVITASDGAEALDLLHSFNNGEQGTFGPINAMITDVEMPRMDGLTLVKKLRQESAFAQLPVLLHTSLSGEVTQTAAQSVGANGYIVKNDVRNLLEMLEDLIKENTFSLGG